jgi:hypothetical protein
MSWKALIYNDIDFIEWQRLRAWPWTRKHAAVFSLHAAGPGERCIREFFNSTQNTSDQNAELRPIRSSIQIDTIRCFALMCEANTGILSHAFSDVHE